MLFLKKKKFPLFSLPAQCIYAKASAAFVRILMIGGFFFFFFGGNGFVCGDAITTLGLSSSFISPFFLSCFDTSGKTFFFPHSWETAAYMCAAISLFLQNEKNSPLSQTVTSGKIMWKSLSPPPPQHSWIFRCCFPVFSHAQKPTFSKTFPFSHFNSTLFSHRRTLLLEMFPRRAPQSDWRGGGGGIGRRAKKMPASQKNYNYDSWNIFLHFYFPCIFKLFFCRKVI